MKLSPEDAPHSVKGFNNEREEQLEKSRLWALNSFLVKELNHKIQQSHFGENHNLKRLMHPNVHCSTIYNSQDMEAT